MRSGRAHQPWRRENLLSAPTINGAVISSSRRYQPPLVFAWLYRAFWTVQGCLCEKMCVVSGVNIDIVGDIASRDNGYGRPPAWYEKQYRTATSAAWRIGERHAKAW